MKIKFLKLFNLLFFISLCTFAQNEKENNQKHKLNIIKINLMGIPFNNYSVQYERIIKKRMAVALGVRFMPESAIPFKDKIISEMNSTDPYTVQTINDFRMSNFAITPAFRCYLSRKGYGHGFYFSPFYRFAKYNTNQMIFHFTDNNNVTNVVSLNGSLTTNTLGILLGTQFSLGKHISLDWWIVGPHFGNGNGSFTGQTSYTMTPSQQSSLKDEINKLDIPLTDKQVTITANSATIDLKGIWAGIVTGLCIGYRF